MTHEIASEMGRKGWELSPEDRRARVRRATYARWLPPPPPVPPPPTLPEAIRIVQQAMTECRHLRGWDANARRLLRVVKWLREVCP